jgi:Mn2+/Fe2+ NRAMP family transporter
MKRAQTEGVDAIVLESSVTQRRVEGRTDEEKKIARFERIDVVIAMAIAEAINASMLIMAAALFHEGGLTGVGDIASAFERLRVLEGNAPAILFGLALLASGFSSSSVGTMSGQVVMRLVERLPPPPDVLRLNELSRATCQMRASRHLVAVYSRALEWIMQRASLPL